MNSTDCSEGSQRYDIVVVGGGLVGAAFACALGQHRLKVALIDVDAPTLVWSGDSLDLRVSAIAKSSQDLFRYLGVWDAILAYGAYAYERMHVWDSQSTAAIDFDCVEQGLPALGHIIENRAIRAALWRRMQDWPNLHVLCPAEVIRIALNDDAPVCVSLADGMTLQTDLVVGADGGLSRVRLAAEMNALGWSYEQHGIVANVETERSHESTAWQCFLSSGPLAFLPMAASRCSIVWTAPSAYANQLLHADDAVFNAQLEAAFSHRLGSVRALGPRATFPLRLHHATEYVRRRIALIGDAAHVVHPLAGQGVNLGLLDAAVLLNELILAQERGDDLGALKTLRRYERARKGDNFMRALSFDGINQLFSSTHKAIRSVRAIGVNAVDRTYPIKQYFMDQAMSGGGQLPPRFRALEM